MAWNPITNDEIVVKKPVRQELMQKVKNNLDYLYGSISAAGGSGGIPNGSFEIDSDVDNIPDKWVRSLYAGGAGAYETTNPAHGAKAYKFTHPGGAGNGGGYLESDYVEITSLNTFCLGYTLWSSVAGIKNIVRISYYTSAKVFISSTDLYSSTSNPTSPANYLTQFTPPATARYIKVVLIGGYTDTNVAGITYFDDISLENKISYSPGNCIIQQITAEATIADNTSPTAVREVFLARRGTLRIDFDLTSTGENGAFGRIYRNGVAVGTSRLTYVTTSWITYSEDIAGWSAGDLCQLYFWTGDVAGTTASIRNFKLKNSFYIGEVVTLP